MRSFDELQQRIARGEQVPRPEMEERYFPLAADHDRLVRWLRAQGLDILRTDDNRVAVFARGPVSAVAQALGVTFARVVGRDGAEYTSAVTAPSLPGDVSPAVLGIHGLQQHIRQRPLALPRQTGPDTTISVGGYYPGTIAQAYNANGLTATGAGQTIAVYALAYPSNSDLTSFWKAVGVTDSVSNIQQVNVAGGPASSPSTPTVEEATLDVEWTSGLAPGATIRIYAANETDPGQNDEILQQIYADLPGQPSLHQLCICIGGNEAEVERDYLIIEAQYMANLASAGVSVFVASGDNGAYPDNKLQTTYPTSDPDVTGVGGTSIQITGGMVTSETAWSNSSGATGGGQSIVFSRPPWQTGAGVPPGAMRLVPDVAAAADPNPGAYIFYNGQPATVGGTSWATPIWTAFCALLNQGRTAPLGLLNPRIYPLNGTSAFREITSGNNGYYDAGPGYNMCTGIGVPDMAELAANPLSATTTVNVPAQLGNVVTTVGQPATFFVVGEGAEDLTYAWQHLPFGSSTWASTTDNATYSGSLTSMLVVNNAALSMTGDEYRCVVSGNSQSATSTPPASITVNQVGVTTIAGWPGSAGSADGTGRAARFAYPGSVRTDSAGNIYIADSYNNTVRKVTPEGVATTVAGVAGEKGSADGPAASALFNGTAGVAVDAAGNLYVADNGNYTIRKISASGTVSTLAGSAGVQGLVDGAGSAARFFDSQNLAIDAAGNLYVADGKGNVIRKVTPSGQVSTFAGSGISGNAGPSGSADGTGPAAEFDDPTGIAVDADGNVYVADSGNQTIRKITPSGVVTTLAGAAGVSGSADGTGSAARFSAPSGVGADAVGNVYVADNGNSTIRLVSPSGVVTTVAGAAGVTENTDGLAADARFAGPGDVTSDLSGIVYVADSLNMTIRRFIPGTATAPVVLVPPANETVNLGSAAVFSVGAAGAAPFTYQWYFNGGAIIGATGPTYTVADAQTADAGSYSVAVSNATGSATSTAATLAVNLPAGYPEITAQPQGGTLTAGGSVMLSVSVTGSGPFTYQWYRNDGPIPGATAPTYAAATTGSYTVAVTNAAASVTSDAAVVGSGSRLINISSREFVGAGANIAIAGIHIDGPATEFKQLLIRGVGPALTQFDVGGALAAPTVSLYDSSGNVMASNTGWGNAPVAGDSSVKAAFGQATAVGMGSVGAFGLPAGSADCAMVAYLPPGNYTAMLTGLNGTTGIGLVEVYEANTSDPAVMTNISTRAEVGAGASTLIAGFVVSGAQAATVLVRGVGPTLKGPPYNVPGTLAQPVVSVYDNTTALIAVNQGWGNKPAAGASTVGATFRAATAADMSAAGAFPLASGSLDSALVLTLPPGSYSAQITSADGTTGVALAEVYQVEP
jgi:sugar lactone lactonase YvrE